MSDYERQRGRHLARTLSLAPALIERLDWSADRITSNAATTDLRASHGLRETGALRPPHCAVI